MSLKVDRVQLDIIINNDPARKALRALQDETNTLTKDMKKLDTTSQEYVEKSKKLLMTKAQMDKITDSIGIAGMSMKELKKKQEEINLVLSHMAPNMKGYAELKSESDAVSARMKELKTSVAQTDQSVSGLGSSFTAVKGALAVFTGIIAAAGGAISFTKSVIDSTGATARELKSVTTGLTWAWDEFKKSIATSDFSNLLTNMGDAISAGREYVNLMADVKKSTRALSITNAELNIEFQKQKVITRDVSKSKEERIEAGKKALEIEMQMTKDSQAVAKKGMDAELLHLRTITKLKDEDIKAAVATYNSNKENLKLANEYNKALETTSAKNSQAASQTRQTKEGEAAYQKTLALTRTASPEIKRLADVMKAMGKTTGEELDAMAEKWVAFANIEAESITKTARVKITLGRLEKGIIDEGIKEEELQTKKTLAAIEHKIGAYSQLTTKVSELNQQLQDMYASGITPSAEFLANLKAQEQKVIDITNAVAVAKNGFDSYLKILPDEAVPDNTDYSSPEDKNPITGEPMEVGTKMSPEDKKAYAIAQAQTTSNALFDIVRNRQQAEFDHKMSLLQREKELELSNKNLTESQKADIEKKYLDKERKLKTEAFKKEKAASIIQAVINTALAIMNALATGGPAAVPLSIAAGITGAAQIAVIASQKVPEFASGRYNVTGAQTGKQYNNIAYTGPAVTGLYTHPALVAENGSEMIIDSRTTRNLMMNYPSIIAAIHSARIPQYYSGRYPSDTQSGISNQQYETINPAMLGLIAENNRLLRILQQEGVQLSYQKLKDMQAKELATESATAM